MTGNPTGSEAIVPSLPQQEIDDGLLRASTSSRRRYARILHVPGAEFNRVFNFMLHDSYMQPHLHPGEEKVEYIHVLQGRLAVMFFDNRGAVTELVVLEPGGTESVTVPAFTWHTYVILSEHAVSYETMMGVYNPQTWKSFADWAPQEGVAGSVAYLASLRQDTLTRAGTGHVITRSC